MTASDDEAGADDVAIPLDGDVLLVAGAEASVTPSRLPDLLRRAQAVLAPRFAAYDRQFECAVREDDRAAFFVPAGHWADLGADLDFADRETDAVRRAHAQQLRRLGSGTDRRDEFETALDVREAVVVGVE
jgi:hypothetical protein